MAGRTPGKSQRLLFAGSLLALAGALVAALWLGSIPPRPISVCRLPDGATLSLDAVTYGKQEVILGSYWQQVYYTLLPPNLKERAGCRVFSGYQDGALTFWIRRSPPGPLAAGQSVSLSAFCSDEHGCTFGWRGTLAQAEEVEEWTFEAFPRRGRMVAMDFYAGRGEAPDIPWHHLGRLAAPNPAPGPHPTWKAPSLPMTARAGDLDVVLTGLTYQREGEPTRQRSETGLSPAIWTPSLRIVRNGKPALGWQVESFLLADATGNAWEPGGYSYGDLRPGGHDPYFHGPHCPDEAAWKLKLELARKPSAYYAPEELWTVKDIPLPARWKRVHLGRSPNRAGLLLELISVAGPSSIPEDWDKYKRLGFVSASPTFDLRATPGRRGRGRTGGIQYTLLRAVDDRGRPVNVRSSASGGDRTITRELNELEVMKGARSVSLTYAIHRSRFVEFLVPPPQEREPKR